MEKLGYTKITRIDYLLFLYYYEITSVLKFKRFCGYSFFTSLKETLDELKSTWARGISYSIGIPCRKDGCKGLYPIQDFLDPDQETSLLQTSQLVIWTMPTNSVTTKIENEVSIIIVHS